jgi:hypothetical protein
VRELSLGVLEVGVVLVVKKGEGGEKDALPLSDYIRDTCASYLVEVKLHLLFGGSCCHLDMLVYKHYQVETEDTREKSPCSDILR